jgi:hypothetical protein
MIRLLPHALEALAKRQIPLDWVERTVNSPDWSDRDPRRLDRQRAFKAIAEAGNRILRVVHWTEGSDTVVLTVYLDRNALKARRS